MSDQLSHTEVSFSQQSFPVILLLDNISGEANIGSLFRLADAFGIEKIIFCGTRPNLKSNRLKRTARNTFETVDFEFFEDSEEVIQILKNKQYLPVALEITSDSRSIDEISILRDQKILLIAGNERHGVSSEVLKKCDRVYHIQMYGRNSSMNVAQSVGIALYEITNALNKFRKK